MADNRKIEVRNYIGYGFVGQSIMRDSTLSVTAKALFAYLASFAGTSNKAWPSVSLIMQELGIGRDTFYKYLRELREKGYVEVEKGRSGGKWLSNIYTLIQSPCAEKPYMVKPYTVNQDTKSNNTIKSNNTNSIYAQSFDVFYKEYPRKQGKQNARKAWLKLKPDDKLVKTIMDALADHKKQPDWLKDKGQFIPYPATWLNGKRWEDDLEEVVTSQAVAEELKAWGEA